MSLKFSYVEKYGVEINATPIYPHRHTRNTNIVITVHTVYSANKLTTSMYRNYNI